VYTDSIMCVQRSNVCREPLLSSKSLVYFILFTSTFSPSLFFFRVPVLFLQSCILCSSTSTFFSFLFFECILREHRLLVKPSVYFIPFLFFFPFLFPLTFQYGTLRACRAFGRVHSFTLFSFSLLFLTSFLGSTACPWSL
jgi:hypothetical protein